MTQCEHPKAAMRPAMLYPKKEARYCGACQSLVFADGHVEEVTITRMSKTRR